MPSESILRAMDFALDQLPDDVDALKAIILSQRAEATRLEASVKAYEALVQSLKVRIAKLNRQKFGPSSEKIETARFTLSPSSW